MVQAQEGKLRTWDAEAIARQPGVSINLTDGPNGSVVASIEVETVRRLVEVKERVTSAANQPAKLLIASGTQPNAFATKQGGAPVVAVNLAMMKLLGQDYDAYAAIIGHEVAHLTLNHGAIRQQREVVRNVASNLLGLVLGRYGVPMGGTISDLSTTIVSRAFSREDESEADKRGFVYMRDAGYDPQGAVRAWAKMSSAQRATALPFLSTHPAPQDRLEELKRLADAEAKRVQMYAKAETHPAIAISSPTQEPTKDLTGERSATSPSVSTERKGLGTNSAAIQNNSLTQSDAARSQNKKSFAVNAAEDLVSKNPDNASAWYRLGAAHLDSGDLNRARKSFDEALRLQPNFSEALFGLGTVHYAMGQLEQVRDVYPKLRKSDPEIAKLYFKTYLLP